MNDIIIRTVYPKVGSKVKYSLSEFEKIMCPMIKILEQSGSEYKTRL